MAYTIQSSIIVLKKIGKKKMLHENRKSECNPKELQCVQMKHFVQECALKPDFIDVLMLEGERDNLQYNRCGTQ